VHKVLLFLTCKSLVDVGDHILEILSLNVYELQYKENFITVGKVVVALCVQIDSEHSFESISHLLVEQKAHGSPRVD